jgi:hypothetical protein
LVLPDVEMPTNIKDFLMIQLGFAFYWIKKSRRTGMWSNDQFVKKWKIQCYHFFLGGSSFAYIY